MGGAPFTRNLGERSGIQLAALRDNSDYPNLSISDQVFAIVGKFPRGRIDKAFSVTQSNQARTLGLAGSLAASVLNEPRVQLYESLRDGSTEAVVSRLHMAASAVLQLIAVKADAVADNVFSVVASAPVGGLFTLKHLECFSDGVIVEVNALEALDDEDEQVASQIINLRLRDPVTKDLLFPEFQGSLDPLAKSETGKSIFLPNIISATTDLLEISVAAGVSVAPTSAFYGKDSNGSDKYVSKLLNYFTEGGTVYAPTDLDAACTRLRRSRTSYGFIASGGTQDQQLITKLLALGYQVNKQVKWDISGKLTPAQAVLFLNGVGGTDSHYSQPYWAPLLADDPLNGGKAVIGASGINIGLSCGRNAVTDANGIAAKNWPVAGSDFPLTRSGVSQIYDPEESELDLLARNGINPVIFIDFASGGRYVFGDSLTSAKTDSDRKLKAVADMSSTVDDIVVRFAQECMQKPMDVAIKRTTDFLQAYFEDLETAKWIKPSAELGGRAFVAEIKPNASRPNDRMDVNYWLKYDGTTRAIYIQQTLSK